MCRAGVDVYEPINTLKPLAQDIWIVDGPLIEFDFGLEVPFSTRMTIVRLSGDRLFIHSPTPLTRALQAEVEAIGVPTWIVGPNRLHYWWIGSWKSQYKDAAVFLAPGTVEHAHASMPSDARELTSWCGYDWDCDIETLNLPGFLMTEVVFFHKPSRTLIVTDLIQNFEMSKVHRPGLKLLMTLGGARDPDGKMPIDMRMTFNRRVLRAGIQKMLDWDPERIVLAHGRIYTNNGTNELRRAFRWLL